MKRERFVKKDNELYVLLWSPKLVEWAFFLFAKDSQQKGVNIFTKRGEFRKSFLKTATHDNIMPYLRVLCSSFNPSDYTKDMLLKIDRTINPQRYKLHWIHFKRGLTELVTYWFFVKWMKNADINFNKCNPVTMKRRRFVYVQIDEYKPKNIKELFQGGLLRSNKLQ